MKDVCKQVAQYLAAKLSLGLGASVFYYALPDDVDTGLVVQRLTNGVTVPAVIDAGVHTLRIIVRAPLADDAYELCNKAYMSLGNLLDDDEPGFIYLEETRAYVNLYDAPTWDATDQQGRKTFLFTAKLITKQ